jgi:hypothetical protein
MIPSPQFVDPVDLYSTGVLAYDRSRASPSTCARWNLPINFHGVLLKERI